MLYMERLMKQADPEFYDMPLEDLTVQLKYLLLFSGATSKF
jgi:hypothetical protein